MPRPDEIKQWQDWLRADALVETSTKEKTWRRCFMHLLNARPRAMEHLARKSVGEALLMFRDEGQTAPEELNRLLSLSGLAASWPKGVPEAWDNLRLFVPAKHPALHALFDGTPWAGRLAAPGPWIGVLRQAPRELWENGKCDRGLDKKASGVFLRLSELLDA